MNQSEPTGSGYMTLYPQKVTAGEVLRNTRLKLTGVPLKDWIICGSCKTQQMHHCEEGGDFDRDCWNCGASHYEFAYFDELARSVPPETTLFRMNRK